MRRNYFLLFILCCILPWSCSDDDIAIIPSPEPALTIEPDSLTLLSGETFQLVTKLNEVELSGDKVEWSSSSHTVIVSEFGIITAIEEVYPSTYIPITATLKDDTSITATCYVKVSNSYTYRYRITLKDKGISDYSLDNPQGYLSAKAVERRQKQNISIDNRDLPISTEYIEEITKAGGIIITQSKWLNTVCIALEEGKKIEDIEKLSFVDNIIPVWRESIGIPTPSLKFADITSNSIVTSFNETNYADSWSNININNGQILHQKGYKGNGIDIAVMDAGYPDLTNNQTLNNININGLKSFIYEDSDLYGTNNHGIQVLSCMATNKPEYYIGTAPEANYWLFRTEDMSSEYPIEEDYWVAAIEYADSVGIDIVNTSLAYITFDNPDFNYTYEQMDGKTAHATRAANIAFEKGMFLVCGAGNDGSWVGTPADSPNTLTVGAVDPNKLIASFSSWGITTDGRMKPDLMALGNPTYVINSDGQSSFNSGTSFASPIICGLAACLWQAYPELSNQQLLDIMRKAGDRYSTPELPYGYGIPDMEIAMQLAE